MSIGYKKISEMITDQVRSVPSLNKTQQDRLEQLCKKLYMLEVSAESISSTKLVEEIMGEISVASDSIREMGE